MHLNRKYFNLYFTTSTIIHWYPLLERDDFKDILIQAFQHAVDCRNVKIFGFVIMENHFHIVWQMLPPNAINRTLTNLLKFTAKQMINQLIREGSLDELSFFRVDHVDRQYQIWKRDSLSTEIFYDNILFQKLNYIHNNRKEKLGDDVTYKYSSARSIHTSNYDWSFLSPLSELKIGRR